MVWVVLLQCFQCFKEIKSSDDLTCEICFKTIPSKQFKSIRCSHRFCCECISRRVVSFLVEAPDSGSRGFV
ncbi:hypothetical protein QJS10_CPA16g00654 [Acorus calamus]|uniref:RING-type domain-containing protein n=1 Tax=Acorus calamus TaxID=4465 RepID=A0AAV9CZ95_ACOCL|nr:hypothetical protein QJS10_CPA16g00654 [Acorus calamus]